MSHTLTEVATFDPDIVVPDGGDSGANRAGDVELIAQRLANRSRALKAVTDNAAVKNAANTFTQANTFSANIVVNADVVTSGAFKYQTPPTITKAISVAQGGGSSVHGQYQELVPGVERVFVVSAPDGGTLGAVRLKFVAFSGGAGSNVHYTVRLMQRHAADFAGTGVPTHTVVDSNTETLTAGPNAVNRTRSFGSLAVSKDETYEIALMCEADSGAGCTLRVFALDYSFVDPGPRNY
jgi:hypothetical protein